MAGLLTSPRPPAGFIGVDIAQNAITASADLCRTHSLNATVRLSDLLDGLTDKELRGTHYVTGCIPQVPCDADCVTKERDLSDYYPRTGMEEDQSGLGLLARTLDQTARRAPHAAVILNVAGRPGTDRIQHLFSARGYTPSILFDRIVRQDPTTSLASLAKIETHTGRLFQFFSEKAAINANEAEKRRQEGKPIFHRLTVMRATLG